MSDRGSESADQAATRRRWITLAEVVAVAGLLIGALTLYFNWSDRRQDQAEKAAESATVSREKSLLTFTGAVSGDTITLTDPAHTISEATVRFPSSLGVAQQDAMPGPRIEAEWFRDTLLKLTDKGADERSGRLPVLVNAAWWDGDAKRQGAAIYDVLWETHGRLIGGRRLVLTGLTLRSRRASGAALDAAWAKVKP